MNLLAESRPEENEVKSEAAFQRLISSSTGLPTQPRTPRVAADRGRYPEEAGQEEEPQRDDTPSDDEDEADDAPFAFSASGGSQPISIQKPRTPVGSSNGDDLYMSISESSSFGTVAMDVDLVSTSVQCIWRVFMPHSLQDLLRQCRLIGGIRRLLQRVPYAPINGNVRVEILS